MIFRVWAPKPQRVELIFRNGRAPMSQSDNGWWTLPVPDAKPGEAYAFSLDGGPPRPDPRSMHQPEGVHEASRVVDHQTYAWRFPAYRAAPVASGVICEIHIGTFTREGTLDAAIEKLDHLTTLGITHVELMPLNAFDGSHGWGYDGVCWYAPHHAYTGPDGPAAVKRFVDACHQRDLAVILDVVYNHLGPSGNYLAEFGPYFSDTYTTPWGEAINLDGPGSDHVRAHIVDNALMWLRDYRFDALRLDAVHAFHDRSATHILEQLAQAVRGLEIREGRRAELIAESDLNDPRLIRPAEAGGYDMHAQWSDDFHHALHALLTGETRGYYADFGSVHHLAKAWKQGFVHDGNTSAFRDRTHGRSPVGLPSTRLLGYAQNHDQIGNRAAGDRLSTLLPQPALGLVAALVLLSPFVPMLFQGEAWGTRRPFQYFTDHRDPILAEAIRQGRRREFADFARDGQDVPDPQAEQTLLDSVLDWTEVERAEHAALLEWHRRLIDFRRRNLDQLTAPLGSPRVLSSESPRYLRVQTGNLLLAFNLEGNSTKVPLPTTDLRLVLASDSAAAIERDNVRLPPWTAAVLRIEERRTAHPIAP